MFLFWCHQSTMKVACGKVLDKIKNLDKLQNVKILFSCQKSETALSNAKLKNSGSKQKLFSQWVIKNLCSCELFFQSELFSDERRFLTTFNTLLQNQKLVSLWTLCKVLWIFWRHFIKVVGWENIELWVFSGTISLYSTLCYYSEYNVTLANAFLTQWGIV